jgi:Cytochrome b5-like Heme/Steroid binding domain
MGNTISKWLYEDGTDAAIEVFEEKNRRGLLKTQKIDDNAEGIWRVHDKIYDLTEFVDRRPGGADWLELTKGVDITEQFEAHHITEKAEQMLKKFYVRDAVLPRNYRFTFNENGFYKTLKRRVASQIGDLDQRPVKISNLISDMMFGLVFATSVLAVKDKNIFLALLSGLIFW